MNEDQRPDMEIALGILNPTTRGRRVNLNGKTYYTFRVKDCTGDKRRDMRLIIGDHGWTFCPAKLSIKECLNKEENLRIEKATGDIHPESSWLVDVYGV